MPQRRSNPGATGRLLRRADAPARPGSTAGAECPSCYDFVDRPPPEKVIHGIVRARLGAACLRHHRRGGRARDPPRLAAARPDRCRPCRRAGRAACGRGPHRLRALLGPVHRAAAFQRGVRVEQTRAVEQPALDPAGGGVCLRRDARFHRCRCGDRRVFCG